MLSTGRLSYVPAAASVDSYVARVPAARQPSVSFPAMAKPTKRRVQGGRTTPKGGGQAPREPKAAEPTASARYTPPIPREVKVSPIWVPILMFALLGLGTVLILVNYTGVVWNTSNWVLLGGLASILAGIVTATQYH